MAQLSSKYFYKNDYFKFQRDQQNLQLDEKGYYKQGKQDPKIWFDAVSVDLRAIEVLERKKKIKNCANCKDT